MGISQCGYFFSDPLRALEQFKSNVATSKAVYGLVVTDIRMPQMDGRTFASELLKIKPNVKIVFMSAFEMDRELLTTSPLSNESLTNRRHLQKPFPLIQLRNVVIEAVATA